MTRALKPDGLPGKVTETALILPKNLTYKEIEQSLGLVRRIGRSVGWWAIDLLLYAEARLPEGQFSQVVEVLEWQPHTLQNALSIGHAFPPSTRRGALDVGHHAAVARLEAQDRTHWLDLAETGEKLANGETKRWSVSRLRQEMRALPASTPQESPSVPDTALMISEGRIIQVHWAKAGVVRYRVEGVSEHDEVLEVRARRAQA